ncbi:unnamed protein product [Debaryomyces fabryi]|nr:unnamed protein product [Debaryomyces fabryi]
MPVLKDHYYRLASEVPQERIEAATTLLQELTQVNENDEWNYALNRLIKGLTSSRQSARLGFSMALIEVLRELVEKEEHELTVSTFLEQVLKLSQVKSSMKGKEERSVLFGRLFGLQVLLNSQLLFNEKVSSSEQLCQFVDVLVELSSIKSWLRETSIFTLCQFIGLLKGNSNEEEALVHILQKINEVGLNLTTEGIAVYLSIPQQNREIYASKIVDTKPNWKNGDPFSKGNLPTLSKALKDVEVVDPENDGNETPKSKNGNSKQKGSWSPRIHFVWDIIIQNYNMHSVGDAVDNENETSNSKKRKKTLSKSSKKQKIADGNEIPLKEFWKVVVDETLFADKSSHERKYWGFEIFIKFLTSMKSTEISSLFTQNFMRCLINQSSQQNRILNKISSKVLNIIIDNSNKDFTKAPIILECLIDESKGGCWNFDLVTKSKCTDRLIAVLNGKEDINSIEVDLVLNQFKDVLISKFNNALASQDESESDIEVMKKSNDNIQKWALDKLLLLFRSNKILLSDAKINSKWLTKILKLLIQHSFFKKIDGHVVSGNIKKICQDRLSSVLSDIINIQMNDRSWPLSTCLSYINKLETSEDYENLLEFDETLLTVKEEALDVLKEIEESLKNLRKNDNQKRDQLDCFKLLFSMILIQFYMGDEEAVTVLDELKMCYNNFFKEEKKDTDSSVFLTEIILSFTSRKATLLKRLSSIAWESFLCSKDQAGKVKLNEECLQLLFDVLEARENKEGQQKLFEGEDEFEAVGDENDSQGSSDGEESDKSDNEDSETSDSDSDSEAESDEESSGANKSNDALSEVDKQTNLKLAQALGIPTESSGEVKFEDLSSLEENDDDSSYQSDSMDDEEMMAMDDQLSKIFKERHNAMASVTTGNKRKAEVIEAKEQMVFFKNRILDLLELFNKNQPTSYLNLSMIKPLIILINLTMDKNLGVKAHKLLKTKLSKTKLTIDELKLNFPSKPEQSNYKESLMSLIEWLQEEADSNKSSNQAHSLACSQSCIIVAKSLILVDELYLDKIIDLYAHTLKSWVKKPNSKIQASMFFDFINWLNSKRGN